MYQPPFSISSVAVNLIAEISALMERYAIRLEQSGGLRLRKASRIKTIHSSLVLEGNRLSEHEVRDVLQGKPVVAPLREILNTLQHHRNPYEDVGINGGINVGINLTPAQQRLVELIRRQPRLSVREMAERLELSQRQEERVVASLREKNVIRRIGSNKSGYWEVLD